MRFGRRKSPPFGLIAGGAGVVLLGLVGALFWFAGQANSRAPEPRTIEIEATNVGPQ